MSRFFVVFLMLGLAACNNGGATISQHETCSKTVMNNFTPPDNKTVADWVGWGKDFKKNVGDAPNQLYLCWFPPRWPLATAEPSSEPVIVDRADLPADAKEATWLDGEMPGYIIYYTIKEDGSGYAYWAVENPPAEVSSL